MLTGRLTVVWQEQQVSLLVKTNSSLRLIFTWKKEVVNDSTSRYNQSCQMWGRLKFNVAVFYYPYLQCWSSSFRQTEMTGGAVWGLLSTKSPTNLSESFCEKAQGLWCRNDQRSVNFRKQLSPVSVCGNHVSLLPVHKYLYPPPSAFSFLSVLGSVYLTAFEVDKNKDKW